MQSMGLVTNLDDESLVRRKRNGIWSTRPLIGAELACLDADPRYLAWQ